ncbi:hypothetical protein D7294_06935 [Streptomyces hoynatensis]|uniref:Uncharacterized protein n=1 Tax=Streptomyces hoynatensis TaxID=1141874 RepID=A0A3A9ZBU4_9ACTN|nr:hypothetical protein D7294_06935 [Streptomyces hoynatensis]
MGEGAGPGVRPGAAPVPRRGPAAREFRPGPGGSAFSGPFRSHGPEGDAACAQCAVPRCGDAQSGGISWSFRRALPGSEP